jgi:hypothetical protein
VAAIDNTATSISRYFKASMCVLPFLVALGRVSSRRPAAEG